MSVCGEDGDSNEANFSQEVNQTLSSEELKTPEFQA